MKGIAIVTIPVTRASTLCPLAVTSFNSPLSVL
jgi:hypothetical protein